jgi:hypothetical protein
VPLPRYRLADELAVTAGRGDGEGVVGELPADVAGRAPDGGSPIDCFMIQAPKISTLLLVAVVLAGCNLLDELDPRACHEAEMPTAYSIADYRVVQANQTHDNTVPLFVFREAGIRVVIEASVERATVAPMHIEVVALGADGAEKTVMSTALDCTRSENVATAHLSATEVQLHDAYDLRVTGHDGSEVISNTFAPAKVDGVPFRLVFVPITVNGVTGTLTPSAIAERERLAYALYPILPASVMMPPLEAGDVASFPSFEAAGALHGVLGEHAVTLYQQDLIPPQSIVVGLTPSIRGGGYGSGGWFTAVTDESDLEMFLHEVGHAFGIPHAVGCNAPGPAPDSATFVDPVGYDVMRREWMSGIDLMSYCRPGSWLGAWSQSHVVRSFNRGNEWGTSPAASVNESASRK